MDSETFSPSRDLVKCCNCGCSCSLTISSSGTWLRSVKRKYDEYERGNSFFIPGLDLYFNPRVQIENECVALREMVASQQQAIQDLYVELEEERNASSSAANEAMSMILRLQREKAEIQMEARQFKRFAEEKMAHDQQEVSALEDLLYKREQAIESLTCEVQAYKHRMMSFGLTEAEADGEREGHSRNPSIVENFEGEFDFPPYSYPPLKCSLHENPGPLEGDDEVADIEIYAFGETPRNRDHLKNLEHRINQMERSPTYSQVDSELNGPKSVFEKVIVGYSPRKSRHSRRFSTDSTNSFMGIGREAGPDFESPRFGSSLKKVENVSQTEDLPNLRKKDFASEAGDDMTDRVYTLDSVHNGVPYNGVTEPNPGVGAYEDYNTTPRDSMNQPDLSDPDIKKLYMRLQALEADRESMRQAIISMRTDKAQMILLKEIAQRLCHEMTPERKMPVRKAPIVGSFSFVTIFKWIASFVFWRKKARRSKYMYMMTTNSQGLRMLLDKSPRMSQWRCLTSTQL